MISTPRSLRKCRNIADLRRRARRRLPDPIFHYLDGGAEDEVSMRRNAAAFAEWEILPRALVDVSQVDTSAKILGRSLTCPLILSPTGMSRLFHRHAESAVVEAADAAGLYYGLSTLSTTKLETIAALTGGPKIFQMYVFRDRGLTRELADRCRAAGYDALCLTVDTPLAGNRERDLVYGMTIPPHFTLRGLWSFASHPRWTLAALFGPRFELANVAGWTGLPGNSSATEYVNSQFDRSVTWRQAEELAALWNGPFVIKGLITGPDARRARDVGATAIMISNHGGRQLDGAPAPIDQVEEVVQAIGGRIEVILDGGVRRGSDILKAMALGADACSIGRPYLYGLAAGGRAGVARALSILRGEFERSMALAGVPRLADIGRSLVKRRK